MDPNARRWATSGPRLPRTRGDGPHEEAKRVAVETASPHPRGWTRGRRSDRGRGLGFPAPAGMDPATEQQSRSPAWLPRTRGDGPVRRQPMIHPLEASPHPRGWTRWRTVERHIWIGFPAPAGMDPSRLGGLVPTPRLPRTRGDGPDSRHLGQALFEASPHPRGWTPRLAACTPSPMGFPAPAGMDPCGWDTITSTTRLPRTRGDGP